MLQAVARKAEQDLVRQRQLLEDLRFDGHRTTEAEAALQKLEAAYRVFWQSLKLCGAQAAIKPLKGPDTASLLPRRDPIRA